MDKIYGGDNETSGRGGYRGRGRGGFNNNRGGPKPPKDFGFNNGDMVVVKLRGLPYQVRYEEVAEFFQDYKYINQSVQLGVNYEGRKNGFGAILFDSQEEAERAAKEMDRKYVKDRYVDLSVISYGEYMSFNTQSSSGGSGGNYGGQQGSYVKLFTLVNEDN